MLKSLITLSLFAGLAIPIYAQDVPKHEKIDQLEVCLAPEVEPEFPGGQEKFMEYFQKTVIYPNISKEKGDQGKVYVGFIVEKDGSISDVKIMRGVTSHLDREAMRVVKKMPKWKPGEDKGKIVRSKVTLPVVFRL